MFLIITCNQAYLEKISQENNFELKTKDYVENEKNFLDFIPSPPNILYSSFC